VTPTVTQRRDGAPSLCGSHVKMERLGGLGRSGRAPPNVTLVILLPERSRAGGAAQ
jgi:hypothetical protein